MPKTTCQCLVFLVVSICAFATSQVDPTTSPGLNVTCPTNIKSQADFDPVKYEGIWNIVYKTALSDKERGIIRCADYNRSIIGNSSESLTRFGVGEWLIGTLTMKSNTVYEDGNLYFTLLGTAKRAGPIQIVYTDYDNYAIEWHCYDIPELDISHNTAFVFSRQAVETFDPKVLSKFKDILSNAGVANTTLYSIPNC